MFTWHLPILFYHRAVNFQPSNVNHLAKLARLELIEVGKACFWGDGGGSAPLDDVSYFS